MVRVTFSLSEQTVDEIRRAAARLGKPQSHVVRDAVADYAARIGSLSDAERRQALAILQRLRQAPRTRPASDVDRELRAVRAARRTGGRRSP
jgi:Arc/MetJ-type ribon-helix-helix transcriptional regulator